MTLSFARRFSRLSGASLLIATLALSLVAMPRAGADVKLPAVLGSNMVLQRNTHVRVWGTADPGEQVTVRIAGQTKSTTADKRGNWHLYLDPMKAGGPFQMTVSAHNTIKLSNILVGEVWVCSGQSNMTFPLAAAMNADKEITAANYPDIRLFTVKQDISTYSLTDCTGSWAECTPRSARLFTAVGYFFGRDLYRALKVPIGLIHSSWGGTVAEAWTPGFALRANPAFKSALQWRQRDITSGKVNQNTPTVLYNAMIHPIVNFAARGVIWYQGESNTPNPQGYRQLLPAMIRAWRRAWREPKLAFMIVLLANFTPVQTTPVQKGWAALREAQEMTADTVPDAGLASAIDIGSATTIHPLNKQEVGRRLCLSALAITYGRHTEYSGPTFKSMKVEGNRAILTFTHTTGGLVAKGKDLKGFALRGAGGEWVWGTAKVEGNKVVVSSPKVAKPAAVRYDWANNPIGNLYNGFGLPANPFGTDAD